MGSRAPAINRRRPGPRADGGKRPAPTMLWAGCYWWYGDRALTALPAPHSGVSFAVARAGTLVSVVYAGLPERLVAAGCASAEMVAPGRGGVRRLDGAGAAFQRSKHYQTGEVAITRQDLTRAYARTLPGVADVLPAVGSGAEVCASLAAAASDEELRFLAEGYSQAFVDYSAAVAAGDRTAMRTFGNRVFQLNAREHGYGIPERDDQGRESAPHMLVLFLLQRLCGAIDRLVKESPTVDNENFSAALWASRDAWTTADGDESTAQASAAMEILTGQTQKRATDYDVMAELPKFVAARHWRAIWGGI